MSEGGVRVWAHVNEREKLGSVETTDFDELLVTAFERVAATFPSRIALGSDAWQPTYRELNETANRLAHRLIACGVGLGDRAAILMAHDAPMVAAVCGTMKAGLIMVPLMPDDPVSHLEMIVEDTEPSVIVTDAQIERSPPSSRRATAGFWISSRKPQRDRWTIHRLKSDPIRSDAWSTRPGPPVVRRA